MSPAVTERYVCQECGASASKWAGRCSMCGAWNAVVEELPVGPLLKAPNYQLGKPFELVRLDHVSADAARLKTGIHELDRVCGGGIVPGSTLLLGGDPGIGKSTLLLQGLAGLNKENCRCIYISGEEAVDQIQRRATRLGIKDSALEVATNTSVGDIAATLQANPPHLFVIDSIQTMYTGNLDSAAGSVGQVRSSAQSLSQFAKEFGSAVILVGHVTKDGQIAGPRVLEHMVDTVLYFEGERTHQYRVLRAVKNRFGPTDEIGIFEMTNRGLIEAENPSESFIGARNGNVAGSAIFAGIEGSRPILVEFQALVSSSPFSTPRRAVVGWDAGRLAMILAVLESRCDVKFNGKDVYLNVTGGLRINEPAADLAAAAALISSLSGKTIINNAVIFGEIGLTAEIRPVAQIDARIKEAEKLGFEHVYTPSGGRTSKTYLQISEIDRLQQLVDALGVRE